MANYEYEALKSMQGLLWPSLVINVTHQFPNFKYLQ